MKGRAGIGSEKSTGSMSWSRIKFQIGHRLRDVRRNAHLVLSRRRRRISALSSQCGSYADHFSYAASVFGVTQIPDEIIGLLEFAAPGAPRVVCEIGTQTCGNSYLLTHALASVTTFMGLDLFVQNWPRMRAVARPGQRIHAINGSSYAEKTAHWPGCPAALPLLGGVDGLRPVIRVLVLSFFREALFKQPTARPGGPASHENSADADTSAGDAAAEAQPTPALAGPA